MADSVAAVDAAELRGLGIEALLMDLDNTLVPWHGYEVSDAVAEWLRNVESLGMKVCIVSNTRYPGRLKRLAEKLQVPFVKGRLKPRKSAFRPALELLDAVPEHSAVIGDQILTDILGGNRLGLFTILVRPLSRREFFGTKISRLFEKFILRALGAPLPVAGEGVESPPKQQARSRRDREQSPDGGSQSKSEQ
jgi:HAD superfamily phosphatase (TIGR01668 family)